MSKASGFKSIKVNSSVSSDCAFANLTISALVKSSIDLSRDSAESVIVKLLHKGQMYHLAMPPNLPVSECRL